MADYQGFANSITGLINQQLHPQWPNLGQMVQNMALINQAEQDRALRRQQLAAYAQLTDLQNQRTAQKQQWDQADRDRQQAFNGLLGGVSPDDLSDGDHPAWSKLFATDHKAARDLYNSLVDDDPEPDPLQQQLTQARINALNRKAMGGTDSADDGADEEDPRLPVGYMWDRNQKTALPVPGLPPIQRDPRMPEGYMWDRDRQAAAPVPGISPDQPDDKPSEFEMYLKHARSLDPFGMNKPEENFAKWNQLKTMFQGNGQEQQGQGGMPPQTAVSADAPAVPGNPNKGAILQQAATAIKAGKDPAGVAQILQQQGIDPRELFGP